MDSVQGETLAVYKGVASETDSPCQVKTLSQHSSLKQALLRRMHMLCMCSQQQRTEICCCFFDSPYMEGIMLHFSDSKAPQS